MLNLPNNAIPIQPPKKIIKVKRHITSVHERLFSGLLKSGLYGIGSPEKKVTLTTIVEMYLNLNKKCLENVYKYMNFGELSKR